MQGLPASGKSTKAQEILKADGNAIRLNKDLLRKMLHFDRFTGKNEELTQAAEVALADYFMTTHQKNIIVDDTNLNPNVVNKWKELARHDGRKFEIVKMDTPVYECIARDEKRDDEVGRFVIKNMARQYGIKYNPLPDIIVDLDGTIANIMHRVHFVKIPKCGCAGLEIEAVIHMDDCPVKDFKKDWKGFFEAISGDTLRKDVYDMIYDYRHAFNIVIVSARPETCKEATYKWLEENFPIKFDTIIMRRAGDSREDTTVKKEMLDKYFDKANIEMVIDDRPRVIRMWQEQGLKVVDVGKGVEF